MNMQPIGEKHDTYDTYSIQNKYFPLNFMRKRHIKHIIAKVVYNQWFQTKSIILDFLYFYIPCMSHT